MKRISAIAQDLTTVKSYLNDQFGKGNWNPKIAGYVPDNATVSNFVWQNFIVGGQPVSASNVLKAGFYPFNQSNFNFTNIYQWFQENDVLMTTGADYHP